MAVLWINERNGDFVVAWAIKQFYIFSYKKITNDGDKGWSITCTRCEDMAYKDNKLYVYTYDHYINVLDFSGNCPKETLEGNHYLNHPFPFVDTTIYKMMIAIANSGEVMIFLSLNELNRKFCICELNLQVGRVGSLGDQLLIFGHGVTIRGPVKDRGIKSDSICLLMMIICLVIICGEERSKVWCVDLATSTITWCTGLDDWSSKIYCGISTKIPRHQFHHLQSKMSLRNLFCLILVFQDNHITILSFVSSSASEFRVYGKFDPSIFYYG
ncbi:BnaC04g11310D [Brassica napus]|uniref:(rape) hypothetical protein n=1 Tax=Brassica napus TaxID=3708 RepID=A0A078G452_BRANA|nr:unnamed protein product [Brassica napus]CDY19468.1 BnaC04g11310D [Brassica napus]